MSAALWCADLGLSVVLIEAADRFGGQLHRIYSPITNYPALKSVGGPDLSRMLALQVEAANVAILSECRVVDADLVAKRLLLADGRCISAKTIIIATGVSRRSLGVPGEAEFRGKGILDSGAGQREEVAGKDVVIVGGGDAALENASILAEYASSVTVIHRRNEFSSREEFVRAAAANAKVRFKLASTVVRFCGSERLTAVEITSLAGGSSEIVTAEHALVRIGVDPNTKLFSGQLTVDETGYISIDSNCQTNLEGVFAVGDVANRNSPTIASAVGMGATAAKNAARTLARDVSAG